MTPKGKAATAANLAGHLTPEETLRTRFNAMKHGMAACTTRRHRQAERDERAQIDELQAELDRLERAKVPQRNRRIDPEVAIEVMHETIMAADAKNAPSWARS